eukprot:30917-Pelagococcus_subviridis.AAC.4
MRRERKSLRIGVHRADAVVWGPVSVRWNAPGLPAALCAATIFRSAAQFASPAWCGFGAPRRPTILAHGSSPSAAVSPPIASKTFFVAAFDFDLPSSSPECRGVGAFVCLRSSTLSRRRPSASVYTVTSTCTPAKNLTSPAWSLTGASANRALSVVFDRVPNLLHRVAVRPRALQEPAVPPQDLLAAVPGEIQEPVGREHDRAIRQRRVADEKRLLNAFHRRRHVQPLSRARVPRRVRVDPLALHDRLLHVLHARVVLVLESLVVPNEQRQAFLVFGSRVRTSER